jgi:hypothetical protein
MSVHPPHIFASSLFKKYAILVFLSTVSGTSLRSDNTHNFQLEPVLDLALS